MITPTETDFSPLLIAVKNNDLDRAKKLLLRGADVNITSADGVTALMVAAAFWFQKMAELLLTYDPDINAVRHDTDGDYTALDYAKYNNDREMIGLLIAHGAKSAEWLQAVSPGEI